jgi:hypothetical protein
MKTEPLDALKADLPPTGWGKILGMTPVVMTVLATALAGLASSEMTRAQYDRALGAQLQSKAGDQWGFFQAKRLRSAVQRTTLDLLASTYVLRPPDPAAFARADGSPSIPAVAAALAVLEAGDPAQSGAVARLDPKITAAIDAVEAATSDRAVAPRMAQVDPADLDRAVESVRTQLQSFETALEPKEQALALLESALDHRPGPADVAATRDFTAVRLRYTARRYDAEARLNQAIAELYELQVRQSNYSAERHSLRSGRFFYGMLAAQLAVIISTLAIAARQRSLLWSLAAAAGLAAVVFTLYVYLNV